MRKLLVLGVLATWAWGAVCADDDWSAYRPDIGAASGE
jgi:hypothetical protein